MKFEITKLAIAVAGTALLALAGCGGGGGTPAPATTSLPVTVIDGPIQGATVCLDKNGNGACDAGEVSVKTDANGKATLTVDASDAPKYPVIAVVDANAIEPETGLPPATTYTMTTPAGQTSPVISPLTTMVQVTMASSGLSQSDSIASVMNATGIAVSPLADYTNTSTVAGIPHPAPVARAIALTMQQQNAAVASVATTGTGTAPDGATITITKADLDKAVQAKLLELLPALVAALQNPAVQTALQNATTPNGAASARAALIASITNAGNTPLTSANVATAVAINQMAATPAAPASAAIAGFKLTELTYTDANNSYWRVLSSATAQMSVDASNKTRYTDRHSRKTTGAIATWSAGADPWRQSDLFWTDSAWTGCNFNHDNTSTVRNAAGNSLYNYCGRETGITSLSSFDISNKAMTDVYAQVIAAGYTNLLIDNPGTVLGSATFPAGSALLYQRNTPQTISVGYYPGSGNEVWRYSTTVATGGIAANQAAGTACNSTETNTIGSVQVTTLEQMMAATQGTPCVNGQRAIVNGVAVSNGTTNTTTPALNSVAPDEGWYQSTTFIGSVGANGEATLAAKTPAATATSYYTGNQLLTVAFKGTGTNPVTYYTCKERVFDGSRRNCTKISEGSYTISSLGDGRVLTFNIIPPLAAATTWNRVFIERGGNVYYGYQNKPIARNIARLNSTAAAALLSQLGLPAVDPEVPLALTPASYQGTYAGTYTGTDSGTWTVTLSPTSTISTCAGTSLAFMSLANPTGAFSCTATVALSTTDAAKADISMGVATTGATFTGTVNFNTGGVIGSWTNRNNHSGTVTGNRL